MTTHDELLEFLEELSAFRWLAVQAGAEMPLLDEIEVLKNVVETTGPAVWHQTALALSELVLPYGCSR